MAFFVMLQKVHVVAYTLEHIVGYNLNPCLQAMATDTWLNNKLSLTPFEMRIVSALIMPLG